MRFCDIPAHSSVKERLRAMADNDRIPHALLLSGPSGIGKFALARAFAQYIHCENPHDGDSCGECASCIQHQTFSHIDTHFVFPVVKEKTTPPVSDDFLPEWKSFLTDNTYMSIDDWTATFSKKNAQPAIYVSESSDLIHKLSFTTHSSRYKIVLLWLPERMNEETANKLLKLIEEPFADTLFIMVSDDPARILPTIYSRVQPIEIKRLPDSTVAQYLSDHYGVDPTDAMALAHIAEGSVAAAIDGLKGEDSNGYLQMFISLMRLAYQRKVKELREWSNDIAALGREKEINFYDYALRLMRENFVFNYHVPELNYLNRSEAQFSVNFARFINERNVEKLAEVFDKARTDIAGNANGKIVNFDLAIKVILLLKQ